MIIWKKTRGFKSRRRFERYFALGPAYMSCYFAAFLLKLLLLFENLQSVYSAGPWQWREEEANSTDSNEDFFDSPIHLFDQHL